MAYKKGKKWYSDFYDENGVRVRKPLCLIELYSEKEAEKLETILKAKVYKGEEIQQKKKNLISLEKFIDEQYYPWAIEYHEDFIRDRICCKFFKEFFKGKKLKSINRLALRDYISWRKKKVLNSTINREINVLHLLLNKAVEWEYLSRNPIIGYKKLKVEPKKIRKLKGWEFRLLLDSAEEHIKPIILCGYLTGMRKSEVRRLKWEDIDLEENYIYVIKAKNNKIRKIFIAPSLREELLKLRSRSQSEYVFLKRDGKPYESTTAWDKEFKKALKKSGIEYCTYHDLKKSFASGSLIEDKEDLKTIMGITGNSDLSVMLKHYLDTDQEAMDKAIMERDRKYRETVI